MRSNVLSNLRSCSRHLVEHRLLLSLGLSAACGIVLQALYPVHETDPMLRLIALERPAIYQALVWSYSFFLYSTPFLIFSVLFSFLYVHFYRAALEHSAGPLPPYPDPRTRADLSLVIGEVHRQLVPRPSARPRWLSLPERGLYTGIAVFGSIGSGKTLGLILPAMRQLFAYRSDDPARKLSGIVLEVKGDLCRHLKKILRECGREEDYVEVSLDGNLRYNPLNNSLDGLRQCRIQGHRKVQANYFAGLDQFLKGGEHNAVGISRRPLSLIQFFRRAEDATHLWIGLEQ